MKTKYITLIALATLSLTACENMLDAPYQGGTQDSEQFAQNSGGMMALATGAVSQLGVPYNNFASERDDDLGYTAYTLSLDLNSGDMVNPPSGYDWFTVALDYSDRTPTYANPNMRLGMFFKTIYAANNVLAQIPAGTEDETFIVARGQLKATRAWAYLALAPYYQFKYVGNEDKLSLPILADTTDVYNNPRVSLSKLYAFIMDDLNDAIADLNGYTRSHKGQIDQQVAYGLRARANLYMEKWAEAASDAAEAVAGYTPYAISELTQPGFCDASDHSWMWALLIPATVAGEELATWPSQIGSFSGNSYTAYGAIYRQINSLLYAKIADTDVRKSWWLDLNQQSPYLEGLTWTDEAKGIVYKGQDIAKARIADVKEAMPPYSNVKFGQRSGIGSPYNDGDWCLMRAEEMLLIQAEAKAKAGDVAGGKSILESFVQTYRDPAFTSKAASAEELSDEVWLQRRIELWGEGFAMADKMRLEKNIVRFKNGDETSNVDDVYKFNIAAGDPWLLLRFPQTEINANNAIEQNTGGNLPQTGDGATLRDGVTD
ncbi:MAG: RagB/SusD family nutrient uptake outer membrane protein [Paludibacteraceae bacterium]|nr:RagB/SusD family nutrient uptake outer membrane protein [Paludibacteraceae bacterium]